MLLPSALYSVGQLLSAAEGHLVSSPMGTLGWRY